MTTLQTAWLTFSGLVVAAILAGFFSLFNNWMQVAQNRVSENNKLADSIRDDLDKERTALKAEVSELKAEVQQLRREMQEVRTEIKEHQDGRERAEKEREEIKKDLAKERKERLDETRRHANATSAMIKAHEADRAAWAEEKEKLNVQLTTLFQDKEIQTVVARVEARIDKERDSLP